MGFFDKNIRKISALNALLLLVALILRVSQYEKSANVVMKVDSVICIVAITFGVFYCVKDYRKYSAHNYKIFMILYFISTLISLVTNIYNGVINNALGFNILLFKIICLGVIAVCTFLLAFGLNLGKNLSFKLAVISLVFSVIKIVLDLITADLAAGIIPGISNLILSIILCVFVYAKYLDKAARGTK